MRASRDRCGLGMGIVLAVLAAAQSASAVGIIRITEWMYNGDEFVELTNVGDASSTSPAGASTTTARRPDR